MANNDLASFKDLFLQTSRERITSLFQVVAALESDVNDPSALERGYIAAHSLKGESLAMGYMTTGAVSQLLEKIFHEVKGKSLILRPELLHAISQALMSLSSSIDVIEKENKEVVLNDILMSLEKTSGITIDATI